jgi:hypothetical protein
MRRIALAPLALTAAALLATATPAAAGAGRSGFGFNSDTIGAGSNGLVEMNGGGSYDIAAGTIQAGGHFSCEADVSNGPLAGCLAGEGTHWKAASLLAATNFRCGTAGEVTKSATTDAHTAVFVAEFFRAGGGRTASFTSQVIVADHDIAADVPGVQNVWIQLVGCSSATANFNG